MVAKLIRNEILFPVAHFHQQKFGRCHCSLCVAVIGWSIGYGVAVTWITLRPLSARSWRELPVSAGLLN